MVHYPWGRPAADWTLLRQRRRGARQELRAVWPVHRVDVRRRAVDVQLENVRPIIVAGEIVPQLHQDAELEIAFGVEDSFLRAHGPRQDAAVRRDDHAAAAAVRAAQEFLRLGGWL